MNEELLQLKREISKEVDALRRDQKAFKCRISVIANLLMPGVGFLYMEVHT